MEFFNSAIDVLQTLVTAIGAGLAMRRTPLWQTEDHPQLGGLSFGVPGAIPPVIRSLLAHAARKLGRLPFAAAKNADTAAFS